jgi:tyrosine phenol-lyase
MNDAIALDFPIHYDIAAVRMLQPTSREQRSAILEQYYFNTGSLPPAAVYVDLQSDGGTGAISAQQHADGLDVSPAASPLELFGSHHADYGALIDAVTTLTGYPYAVAFNSGRQSEAALLRASLRAGTVVCGNMLFPTTRYYVRTLGAELVDVITERTYALDDPHPFKGEVDLDKLAATLSQPTPVACVLIETAVNGSGGHPISLANLQAAFALCQQHHVPLYLDASRILENAYLIQQREAGQESRSVAEIVRALCDASSGWWASAAKDFGVQEGGMVGLRDETLHRQLRTTALMESVSPRTIREMATGLRESWQHDGHLRDRAALVQYLWQGLSEAGIPVVQPSGAHAVYIDVKGFFGTSDGVNLGESLAAFVYLISGVRVTKGPVLSAGQQARGQELMRLTIPARRYLKPHIEHVIQAFKLAFAHREHIPRLSKLDGTSAWPFESSRFAI